MRHVFRCHRSGRGKRSESAPTRRNLAAYAEDNAFRPTRRHCLSEPATSRRRSRRRYRHQHYDQRVATVRSESIFNREAIERAGSRSLGDFFQALPQNSGATFTENQNENLSPGGAAVALRGLGPDATLVLVNGRRVAPYPFAQAGITAFVDLNSLPLAAIQQIDILRDGASAIYGTDAIAGVVNVRFLQKFHGTLVTFGYGNTTDTDTSEYRASVISGYSDERRGLELVVVVDYFHREALFQVDRYFSRSIDQRRQGGSSFLSSVANPGTVFDPVTGDPFGSRRIAMARPRSLSSCRAETVSIARPSSRWCRKRSATEFTLRAKVRLAPAVDLFTEFGYRNILTEQQLAPAPIEGDVENISVPAANPFNPFGDDVVFRYRVTEAGPRIDEIDTDVYRAVAGLNVNLPGTLGIGNRAALQRDRYSGHDLQ